MKIREDHSHVDGNALAGALGIAFGTDVTNASAECGHCGSNHRFAEAKAYLRNPGMVMCCPDCSGVELILVEIKQHIQMTIRGLASIRLAPSL